MFFRKERKDIKDIKEAIEPVEEDELSMRGMDELQIKEELPAREREESAPLFVKVEKYRDILKGMQEMKVFVSGVKQLFNIIHELESVRADALNILRATVQRMERGITEIDSELLRPRGLEIEPHGEPEISHIEDSLADLQRQLAMLRKELQELK